MDEYVIEEWDNNYEWCLFLTLGDVSKEEAEELLWQTKWEHPNNKFRISKVPAAACWWRQGGLD